MNQKSNNKKRAGILNNENAFILVINYFYIFHYF